MILFNSPYQGLIHIFKSSAQYFFLRILGSAGVTGGIVDSSLLTVSWSLCMGKVMGWILSSPVVV